jgi:O-antigen ligase
VISNEIAQTGAQGASLRGQRVTLAALFALVLLALIEPLTTIPLSPTNASLDGEGNVFRQFAYAALFLIALKTAIDDEVSWFKTLPLTVWLMLGWCFASIAWSAAPSISFRRIVLTAMITFSIFALVNRAGVERTKSIVRTLLVALLVCNYITVIVWPSWGIHQEVVDGDPSIIGAWRGIILQKNFAGAACAFTVLYFLFDAANIRAAFRALIITAAVFFLLKTESKTSISLLIISGSMACVSLTYSRRYKLVILLTIAACGAIGAIAIIQNWVFLISYFSDGEALTGRGQIWPFLIEYASEHILLGAGYGAFWNIGGAAPILQYTDGWISEIASGHNGYLDILVQTGIPGLLITILATVVSPARRLLLLEGTSPGTRALLFAIITFCVGHNLTESSVFNRDSTVNVMLMTAIAMLAREVRQDCLPEEWS